MKHSTLNSQLSTLKLLTLLLTLGTWHLTLFGQLTATVTPGYQFGDTERPTVDTLNQLGQPSIAISGTISGSVGLTAGSVTGTHLAASVVDGVTVTFTNTTPQAIKIKDSGVSTNQISTNIAGLGLSGGGGSALAVSCDTNIFSVATDELRLRTLVVTNMSIPAAATVINSTHGFTNAMASRAVLVCTNSDLGYSIGDEVDLLFVTRTNFVQVHQLANDATKVYLMLASASGAGTSTAWQMRRRDTALFADLATNKWLIKIYARP